jgi:hypothetical protein
LALEILNVRENQSLSPMPPYYSSGGHWTVFDLSFAGSGAAPITVAVKFANSAKRNIGGLAFIPSDREASRKFVVGLAAALAHDVPPERSPEPLKVQEFWTETVDFPKIGQSPRAGNCIFTRLYLGRRAAFRAA